MAGIFLCWLAFCAPAPLLAATFTPSISLGAGYDDNVALAQEPRGDFFWLARPAASLEAGRPENRFTALGSLDYAVYQRLNDYTRMENASLGLKYHYATSPQWSMDADNTLSSSYDAVDQTDTGELTRVRTGGGRHDRNVTSVRSQYNFGPQTLVNAGYTLGFNRGNDDQTEDSSYQRVDLGGAYRFNPDWRAELKLEGTRDDFEVSDDVVKSSAEARLVRMMGPLREAFLSLASGAVRSESAVPLRREARDYDTHTAKLGYKAELSPRLGFEAAAGASQVQANEQYNTAAGKVYPAGNLALTYKRPRWQIRGYAEYKLAEYDSLGENSGLTVTSRAGTSWLWQLAQHWMLTAQADFVHDDFQQNPAAAGVTTSGDVDSVRLGSALSYRLARDWRLSLDYRYLNRDAEVNSEDRSQNRLLMLLSADWPQRW